MSLRTAPTLPHEVALSVLCGLDDAPPGTYAHRLERESARAGLAPERRGIAYELVTGAQRQRLALDHLLDSQLARPGKVDPKTREILRLGAYQLLYADGTADHAVVDGCATLARRAGRASMTGLVNGVLRGLIRRIETRRDSPRSPERELPVGDGRVCRFADAPYAGVDAAGALSLRYSYPRWLVERWLAAAGADATLARLAAGNRRPTLVLRVDRRRASREAALERLVAAGHEARALAAPWAIAVAGGDPSRLPGFADGWLVVQDEVAMRMVEMAPAAAGQRVLELGAAPGGKTLQLLERAPGVRVLAVDLKRSRLGRLRAAVVRRSESGVSILAARGDALPLRDGAVFDGVIIDAPCSNTGVIGKRADLRWRLRPEDIAELAALQARLLDEAAQRVAPGGWLAYSTCSVEPEENEAQVARLLDRGFTPASACIDLPESSATACGGYAAVLARR